MQYRTVPKNGDKLSALGFGTMRLPMKGQTVDEERAIKQIRYAIDNGVNYVDTAIPYHGGESEKILGKALLDGYREKVKVATKLPPFLLNKPEEMDKLLNMQLKNLQTKTIDYYLLHALDADGWKKLQDFGVLKFLEKAQADGKIVNPCFSFHGLSPTFKEIVDAYDWVACLLQYNFLDEEQQAGTKGVRYAASQKLAVFVMEPLRGGMLAGPLPEEVKQIYETAKIQRSAAEWSLRWVWNHPEVTVVLSGMNEESQVAENIRTASTAFPNSLSADELAVMNKVATAYKHIMKVPCTGCGYCMPCPAGVNIPRNFSTYNQYYMFDDKDSACGTYAMVLLGALGHKPSDASLCIKCGKCLEHCPQHIDIPTELESVKNTLGGPKTQMMISVIKQSLPKHPATDEQD
jgi:predicted aldo/keto reductase-like oxidoreductase